MLAQCRPQYVTVADTVPYSDSIKNLIYGIDCATHTNEETHYDEDSFFDLVLTGPDGNLKEDYNSKYVKQGKSEFYGKSKASKQETFAQRQQFKKQLRKRETREFSVDNSSSKQFARAAEVPKFLKLVKPLYARNSKMCTDKIKISDQVSTPLPSPFVQSFSSSKKQLEEKQGNRVAGFGAVCKHVMKSRSTASSSFAGASSLPTNRRDDSLLEQNDGIQGAILHCKRSYSTASKDFSRLLPRSTSEDVPRGTYYEEQSRWSI
ncbi:probable membrane-associated kinase regulator 2 [Lycium ferocissimum]|uniref:probable membrane-associated kinase regulator 2 n=1 Tax=Lycium ferocissimum TaxID=112874 RepID=UPI002814C60C|nr:probable membrane-associated kinase regulator 2 [Lycium ferocissimum]